MNREINYYFDMDGVITIYERDAYPPKSDRFSTLNEHYYATVKPDGKMIDVIKGMRFDKNCSFLDNQHKRPEMPHTYGKHYKFGYRLHTLSALTNRGDIFLEQKNDKLEWLKNQFGILDSETDMTSAHASMLPISPHFSASNKRYIGEALSGDCKLYRTDILIDDYNNNLIEWENAGGTSIKYCNGINSPESWKGLCITENMTSEQIVQFLYAIAESYDINK